MAGGGGLFQLSASLFHAQTFSSVLHSIFPQWLRHFGLCFHFSAGPRDAAAHEDHALVREPERAVDELLDQHHRDSLLGRVTTPPGHTSYTDALGGTPMLDTTAGRAILAPEDVHSLLVQPVEQESLPGLVGTVVAMTGNSLRAPSVQTDPAAQWVSEGSEIAASDAVFDEVSAPA